MNRVIYCLVDVNGNVYAKDGAGSYAEVAAEFGLNENECRQCRFDLTTRRQIVDRGQRRKTASQPGRAA